MFRVAIMIQFFWQDNLLSVSKFLSVLMDEMLSAYSDDHSHTSGQHCVAGKGGNA